GGGPARGAHSPLPTATTPELPGWRPPRWPPAYWQSVWSPARGAPIRPPPTHPRRTRGSSPAVLDGRPHFSICQRGLRSPSNPLLQVAQPLNAPADFVEPLCALRDEPGDRFVVAGNHDFLAFRDAIEKLPEPGFCLEGGDRCHRSSRIDQSLTSLSR